MAISIDFSTHELDVLLMKAPIKRTLILTLIDGKKIKLPFSFAWKQNPQKERERIAAEIEPPISFLHPSLPNSLACASSIDSVAIPRLSFPLQEEDV